MNYRWIIPLILLGFISTLALSLAMDNAQGAVFVNDNFDDNVQLIYTPEIPSEYEEVNVTIHSLNDVELLWAYIWLDIRGGDFKSSGAYEMNLTSKTDAFVELYGYPGNTNISFYVTVYDGVRQLRSRTYYYNVEPKISWRFHTFEANMNLSYGPVPPSVNDTVEVKIEGNNPVVIINRADLNVSFQLPGNPNWIDWSKSMTRIDDTSYKTNIPYYHGNTTVVFSVTAYDEYDTPMTSRDYKYVVEVPEETYHYGIIAGAYDNIISNYIEAEITVYNSAGYLFSMETVNGLIWTPTDMVDGEYNIRVEPLEIGYEPKEITVRIDENTTESTFLIYYDVKDISTGLDIMDFPSLRVIVTLAIVTLMFPIAFLYLKDRGARERESAEEKKQAKKKGKIQEKTEIKGYRKIVIDLEKRLRSIERKKDISTAVAFGFLGFFGALWCPFYPWWMVMIIALVTGAIGYRFPYIALLFISFAVIGSTAFQTAQFGLLFMIFALIVCVCSLFNWKFGYLSFLTVFLSTFGISFLVPVFSIFLFSLFTSITVTVVSGLFLSMVTATGNVINLSFIVSPYATEKSSITTFSKVPGDKLFSPTQYFNAFGGIRDIDGGAMISFIKDYMSSMVPILQVLVWVLMVLVVYLIKKKLETKNKNQTVFIYSFTAGGILLAATIGGMFLADFTTDLVFSWKYIFVYVLAFPALLFAISLAFILRGAYSEFYVDKKTIGVGTRISDMMSFRKSSFENVGGLKGVKSEITDSMIGPLLRPEMSRKYGVVPPKGMILFGPPGCGKTLLMRVIATELNVEMIGVKCSDVMSKWYGESENLINDLFKIAREKQPCLLFLDEIDAIAKRRDFYSADDVTPRLLSIMLSEMDGMDEFSGIIIIAATNKPELVDPALLRPGRFDKVMYVPPPGPRDRMEILKIHMKGKPTGGKINVKEIAELTDGYSGADIANLCRECATQAMRRALSTKRSTTISMDDFRDMIEILKPSISKKMQKDYIELQSHYERKVHKITGGGKKVTKESGRGEQERSYRVSRYDGGEEDDEGWDDDYDEEDDDRAENGWEEADLRETSRYREEDYDEDDDWD